MDRNRKRVTYVAGGAAGRRAVAYGMQSSAKKKKRGSALHSLKLIVPVVLTAVLIVFVIGWSLTQSSRSSIGRATRIGATLSQNITPFGDSVIFYDGTTLHCMNAGGGNEWSYQIGTNADYDATEERVVAWSGNDLYILNSRGRLTYNDKMADKVQFASIGENYVAAFVGEADNGVITVINNDGQIVDNITIENQTLLDIGFFFSNTTSSGAQATELMWVLGLDTTGTVISTELQTFQPGKLSTGKSSLGENIAYSVYHADGLLNIVDTRQIMHYNYRALEEKNPTLIYGYTMEDVRTVGNVTYQLLIPAQETNEGYHINNVRLMYGATDRVLHLPRECISAQLGTRGVYGFSNNTVYVCRYGDNTFSSHTMPVNVTAVLGMITDNRVVVASGSEIYVIELPE